VIFKKSAGTPTHETFHVPIEETNDSMLATFSDDRWLHFG